MTGWQLLAGTLYITISMNLFLIIYKWISLMGLLIVMEQLRDMFS
jgi:hypothetical protein